MMLSNNDFRNDFSRSDYHDSSYILLYEIGQCSNRFIDYNQSLHLSLESDMLEPLSFVEGDAVSTSSSLFPVSCSRPGQLTNLLSLSRWGQWSNEMSALVIYTCFNVVMSFVLHLLYIRRGRTETGFDAMKFTTSKEKATSLSSLRVLLGWTVIIPSILMFPFILLRLYNIHSSALVIFLVYGMRMPSLQVLRTTAVMCGTCPSFVRKSITDFMIYMLLPASYIPVDVLTEAPRKVSWSDLQQKCRKLLSLVTQTILLYSVLQPNNFRIYPGPDTMSSVSDMYHLGNLFHQATLLYLVTVTLEVGSMLLAILPSCATGYAVADTNQHPFTDSDCLSDYFLRQWELGLQDCLERGVYRPLRCFTNIQHQSIGIMANFIFRGIMHVYGVILLSYLQLLPIHNNRWQDAAQCSMMFFLVTGTLVALESTPMGEEIIEKLKDRLKPELLTAMLLFIVIYPLSGWYTTVFVQSGFFEDVSTMIPLIDYTKMLYLVRK
jgi:hypothetical protein